MLTGHLPFPIYGLRAAVVDNHIYVTGGWKSEYGDCPTGIPVYHNLALGCKHLVTLQWQETGMQLLVYCTIFHYRIRVSSINFEIISGVTL